MRTRRSYTQSLRWMAVRAFSLLAILAIAFPSMGSVKAQENPPNSSIEGFAWFDRYALVNWPAGVAVDVSIAGPDFTAETFTPDSDNGWYEFFPGVDLQPGTIITATNGITTKVLEISPLSAIADGATGTVTGVGTPNGGLHMQTVGDHFQNPIDQDISVDAEGNWSVTIEANLPWEWATEGYMWEGDEDGDVTYAIWHVHQEIIEVWLASNEIIACDWPLNTELTFMANGETLGTAFTTPVFWYDGTVTTFPAGDFDLEPGMEVTVTDGITSKSTIVQDMKITYMDVDTDRVYGYAPAGAELELASTEDSPIFRFFKPGEDQNWQVDYQEPSLNGVTVDLNQGDYLRLFTRDAEKDSTVWDAYATSPSLSAFPTQEWVESPGWNMGADLHLSIDDPATEASPDFEQYMTLPADDPNALAHFDFMGQYDLKPGDVVEMTDGIMTRSYTTRNLSVISVDAAGNIVHGTADSGVTVRVWPNEWMDVFIETVADESGAWSVDFSSFDIPHGNCGRSQINEEDGNGTVVDWCGPKPYFTVFPEIDAVEAWEFPRYSTVTLTIAGQSWNKTADVTPWGEPRTWAWLQVDQDYNIQTGDQIQLSDGMTTIQGMVQPLSVTEVNIEADTVGGKANPGARVQAWPHETGIPYETTADAEGNWQLNFSDQKDLQTGTCGRSQVMDEYGMAIAVDWCAPKPWLIDFPENDAVEGWEWPQGDPVTLTVDQAPGLQWSGTAEVTSWGDPRTYVRMDIGNDYNLQIGDTVTLTDGTITIVHTVQNLVVLEANQNADFIAGTADPGTKLQVWPHGWDQQATVAVTVGETGTWQANFTDVFDLVVGTCGRSQIQDGSGFNTAVDWCAPEPSLIAFPGWDAHVEAFDYLLGANVHLAVDDPATELAPDFEADQAAEVTPWNQNAGWTVFNLAGVYDLKAGDTVTLTSAGITPTVHTVQELSIETVNLKTDTLTGTAAAGALLQVRPWGWEQDFSVDLTVEAGGWQVDFGALGLDLVEGMNGRVQIPVDGNYTALNWDTRPTYNIYAYDPLNGTTQQVTYLANTDEYNPSWSPNGKRIAHDVVWRNGSQSIYITDVITGASTPLAGAENGGNDATWSPNGKWIAFDQRWTDTPDISIVPAAGGSPTLIKTNAFNADWAPSGKRLVFTEKVSGDPNAPGPIKTIAVDGGKGGETLIADWGNSPAWSPDGNWIAYDLDGQIWKVRVNVQGTHFGSPILVVSMEGGAYQPTWSRDSLTIAFHGGSETDSDIWTVPAAGGSPARLSGAVGSGDYDPAYAKNSLAVSFGSFEPGP